MTEADNYKKQKTIYRITPIQKYLHDLGNVSVLYFSNGEWNSFIVCSLVSWNNKDRSSALQYQLPGLRILIVEEAGHQKQYALKKLAPDSKFLRAFLFVKFSIKSNKMFLTFWKYLDNEYAIFNTNYFSHKIWSKSYLLSRNSCNKFYKMKIKDILVFLYDFWIVTKKICPNLGSDKYFWYYGSNEINCIF